MKIIFTLLATLFIMVAHSQNFTFEPTDTLEKTITASETSDLNINIIRNPTVDTLKLEYELITNTLPEEWYAGYCDNHGCWGSLPESGAMSPMFDVFESYIKLSIGPNEIEGSGTVQYYVYETGDYNNGLVMTFHIETPGYVGLTSITGLQFQFYPNPIEDRLNIKSEEQLKQISIFDLTGKMIYQENNPSSLNIHINAIQWQTGIYFLEVINENGMIEIRKLLKN